MLCLAGAAALAAFWPRPAAAAKVWRVGLFEWHPRGDNDGMAQRFVSAMRELGYAEGRDIEYVHRYPDGRSGELQKALAVIAHELVRARLDAIVANGTVLTKALQQATTTIPIVTNVGDPVRAGFAKSLARPGGNITGVAGALDEIYLKTFQNLKAIIPGDWALAIDYGDGTRDLQYQISPVEGGARACGIPIRAVSFKGMDAGEAHRALASMRGQGIRVLITWESIAGIPDDGAELALATKYGLVVAPVPEDYVAKGALISYSTEFEGMEARKAFQLTRILRGTPPGEIPFETPTTFRLVINRKTAKLLGLTIPPEILLLADKVYD